MENLYDEIVVAMDEFKVDASKQINDHNKAAGTRSRKISSKIGKMLLQWRKLSVKG